MSESIPKVYSAIHAVMAALGSVGINKDRTNEQQRFKFRGVDDVYAALNPLLVLILIPFNKVVLYPLIESMGVRLTALRRMGAGIAFAGAAWIVVGIMQLWLDGGDKVAITWQVLPYALLTLGEVLVSTTGLEFAYSQAPMSMKGVIMSFWSLSVTVGNLWVLLSNVSVRSEAMTARIAGTGLSVTAFQMFFFAGFALLAALLFALYARGYRMQDNYRS